MIKTGKDTAQSKARTKARKIPRAKTRVKAVRRRKAVPEALFASLTTSLTDGLARLEPPREAMSRLEARIPTELYEVMERAAKLRGLTMTSYVTTTMVSDAQRTIEESSIIRLSRDDQTAFANALIEPPAPNAKLVAAARRHAALIR
jgi:uncharacterized protein (DUF1778 family)